MSTILDALRRAQESKPPAEVPPGAGDFEPPSRKDAPSGGDPGGRWRDRLRPLLAILADSRTRIVAIAIVGLGIGAAASLLMSGSVPESIELSPKLTARLAAQSVAKKDPSGADAPVTEPKNDSGAAPADAAPAAAGAGAAKPGKVKSGAAAKPGGSKPGTPAPAATAATAARKQSVQGRAKPATDSSEAASADNTAPASAAAKSPARAPKKPRADEGRAAASSGDAAAARAQGGRAARQPHPTNDDSAPQPSGPRRDPTQLPAVMIGDAEAEAPPVPSEPGEKLATLGKRLTALSKPADSAPVVQRPVPSPGVAPPTPPASPAARTPRPTAARTPPPTAARTPPPPRPTAATEEPAEEPLQGPPDGAPDIDLVFIRWKPVASERVASVRTPGQRIVVVHENDVVEGLKVERIRPGGIEFQWRGQHFIVHAARY